MVPVVPSLAYAGVHPNKLARLILDSPLPLDVASEAAAEQKVKGQQAALDVFAAQCAAVTCAPASGRILSGGVDSTAL